MRDDQQFFATLDMASGMRRPDGEHIMRRAHWLYLRAYVERIIRHSQIANGPQTEADPLSIQSIGEPAAWASEGAK